LPTQARLTGAMNPLAKLCANRYGSTQLGPEFCLAWTTAMAHERRRTARKGRETFLPLHDQCSSGTAQRHRPPAAIVTREYRPIRHHSRHRLDVCPPRARHPLVLRRSNRFYGDCLHIPCFYCSCQRVRRVRLVPFCVIDSGESAPLPHGRASVTHAELHDCRLRELGRFFEGFRPRSCPEDLERHQVMGAWQISEV